MQYLKNDHGGQNIYAITKDISKHHLTFEELAIVVEPGVTFDLVEDDLGDLREARPVLIRERIREVPGVSMRELAGVF